MFKLYPNLLPHPNAVICNAETKTSEFVQRFALSKSEQKSPPLIVTRAKLEHSIAHALKLLKIPNVHAKISSDQSSSSIRIYGSLPLLHIS